MAEITRRKFIDGAAKLALASSVLPGGRVYAAEGKRTDNVLRVAVAVEPGILDPFTNAAGDAHDVLAHVTEGLFSVDKDGSVVPQLAEGFTVNEKNTSYAIKLRKGIKFQDGSDLTMDDVVASLKAYTKKTAWGKQLASTMTKAEAAGPDTLVLEFKAPNVTVPFSLSNTGPNGGSVFNVTKKAVLDAAGDQPIRNFIGTGPFQVAEQMSDDHILLTANRNFPDQRGILRKPQVDQILFKVAPEPAIREAGVTTGEFDVALNANYDTYQRLALDKSLASVVIQPWRAPTAILNKTAGRPFGNKLVRQAFSIALDMGAIMQAITGNKQFYKLDGGLIPAGNYLWTEAGSEDKYNKHNIARAKELLAQAGYKGEEILWMTSEEDWILKPALLGSQYLSEAGFNIRLQYIDRATTFQRRAKPDLWDVFVSGTGYTPEPTLFVYWSDTYPGWWVNKDRDALVQQLSEVADRDQRKATWEKLHRLWWDDMPAVLMGDLYALAIKRADVQGFETTARPHFSWVSFKK